VVEGLSGFLVSIKRCERYILYLTGLKCPTKDYSRYGSEL